MNIELMLVLFVAHVIISGVLTTKLMDYEKVLAKMIIVLDERVSDLENDQRK